MQDQNDLGKDVDRISGGVFLQFLRLFKRAIIVTFPTENLVEEDDELKSIEQIEKALEIVQSQRIKLDQR